MKWTYILVFSQPFMNDEEVKHFLNARDDVDEWAHIFENFYLLVSDNSADALGDRLLDYAKKNQKLEKPKGRFLIMECNQDRNGWLPTVAWNLMMYKTATSPKEEKPNDGLDEEIPF